MSFAVRPMVAVASAQCFSAASSSSPKAVAVLLTFDAGLGICGGHSVEEAGVVGAAVKRILLSLGSGAELWVEEVQDQVVVPCLGVRREADVPA